MSNCGSVSMDRYWGYIATPLFFIVIGFGTYTLFVTQDIQMVDKDTITSTVNEIKQAASAAKGQGAKPQGTKAPDAKGPGTKAPDAKGPGDKGPGGKPSGDKGPGTKPPGAKGPGTKPPDAKGKGSPAGVANPATPATPAT